MSPRAKKDIKKGVEDEHQPVRRIPSRQTRSKRTDRSTDRSSKSKKCEKGKKKVEREVKEEDPEREIIKEVFVEEEKREENMRGQGRDPEEVSEIEETEEDEGERNVTRHDEEDGNDEEMLEDGPQGNVGRQEEGQADEGGLVGKEGEEEAERQNMIELPIQPDFDVFIIDNPQWVSLFSKAGDMKIKFYDDPEDDMGSISIRQMPDGQQIREECPTRKYTAAFKLTLNLFSQARRENFRNLYIGLELKNYNGLFWWKGAFANTELVRLRWMINGETVKKFTQRFENGLHQIKVLVEKQRDTTCDKNRSGDHKNITFTLLKGPDCRSIVFPVDYT